MRAGGVFIFSIINIVGLQYIMKRIIANISGFCKLLWFVSANISNVIISFVD